MYFVCSFVRHKVRQSCISRTVWHRITNFTRTFTLVGSTTTPHMTSLASSDWKWRLRRLLVKFLENGLRTIKNFYTLIMGNWPPQTCSDVTSLPVSGRLQNAIKYRTKVCKTGPAVIKVHSSVMVWGKARSPVATHCIWLNVGRDCKDEQCCVLPSPTNWWASCYISLSYI